MKRNQSTVPSRVASVGVSANSGSGYLKAPLLPPSAQMRANPAHMAPQPDPEVWLVNWSEPSSRKNKKWDFDGVLVINGLKAKLYDGEACGALRSLGSCTLTVEPDDDVEMKLCGKDVKILERTTYVACSGLSGVSRPAPSSAATPSASTALKTQHPPGSINRRLALPAATVAAQQARSQQNASQKFKMPVFAATGQPTLKLGLENRAPSSDRAPGSGTPNAKGKERWSSVELLIDGTPAKKRQRLDVDDGAEAGPGPSCVRSPPRPLGARTTSSEPASTSALAARGSTSTSASISRALFKSADADVEEMDLDGDDEDDGGDGLDGLDDIEIIEAPKTKAFKAPVSMEKPEEAEAGKVETRYYVCQWWKSSSTQKNPKAEGDGILICVGKKITLLDEENRKELAVGVYKGGPLSNDATVRVGGKVCRIDSPLESAKYLNGASRKTIRTTIAPAPPPAKPASSSAFFALPTLKTKSFFGSVTPNGDNLTKKPQPRFPPDVSGAIVMMRPTAEHQATFNSKKNLPVVDVVIDPILGDALREHQKDGVKWLYECVMGLKSEGQGCILADEMGLGKTIQAITLIWTLLKQNPYWGAGTGVVERVAIVCPVTLVKNWQSEIKKWLGRDRIRVFIADQGCNIKSFVNGRNYQVLIIGYDKLRTCIDEVKACQPPIGLLICDEGHRLKSAGAKTTKALQTLNCKRRVILSGTPIQNDLSEYHSMVDFVNPGLLDSYKVFKRVFESVIMRSRDPSASAKEKTLGQARSEQLSRISEQFMLRRTAEVIRKYLPPKLEYSVFVVPTAFQLDLYERILQDDVVQNLVGGGTKGSTHLSSMMVLRQLCNTPGLLMQAAKAGKSNKDILTDHVVEKLNEGGSDPFAFKLSAKMQVLGTMLSELRKVNEEKIVIVSNFTQTLEIIEKHCKREKYPFCRLDGTTNSKDRVPMVEAFNRGTTKSHFVFLLSSKSGGTGLNITGASRLVLIDGDWNPSNDLQAMARIHREGQKKQCVIYRFLTAGMIDEKVFQRQITKLGLSGAIMNKDGGAADGKSKDDGDAFTLSEIRDIFKLHRGVACQTHELLGCRCHFGESQGEAQVESDDEEQEQRSLDLGFTQASQYPFDHDSDDEDARPTKQRKNLSMLNEWQHHNCSDQQSVDEIEDQLLRAIVYQRVLEASDGEEGYTLGCGGAKLKGGQVSMAFAHRGGLEVVQGGQEAPEAGDA